MSTAPAMATAATIRGDNDRGCDDQGCDDRGDDRAMMTGIAATGPWRGGTLTKRGGDE